MGASAQGSKPLLELAATGCMAEALAALGASEQEDPLVEGVEAIERAFQIEGVAALASKLEAGVPETAGFGPSTASTDNG